MLIWYSRRRWDSSDHNDNGAFALHFDQNLDTSSSGSSVCRRSWVIFYTLSEFEQNLGKRQPRVLEESVLVHLVWGVPAEMVESVSDI